MCKVMILKGIQDSAIALDFMKAVAPNMSVGNTDGIGYSAINSKNKLFSEKWYYNSQFLDTESVLDDKTANEINELVKPYAHKLPGFKPLAKNYQTYGEVTRDDLRTVTMHTRYATCGKTFENTHPFIDHEMSLIHNGVISNADVLNLNKVSTCDSENALQLYNNEQLNLATTKVQFQTFLDQLKGYWAFAFLAKNADDKYMLDVVREGANLYWAALPELGADCIVFATTKEIIETGVKSLGLPERKKIFLLPESTYHRFDAVSGEYTEDYELEESALNNIYYYPGYGKNWKSKFNVTETSKVIKDVENQSDDTQEGYSSKSNLQETGDFLDAFYETDMPLIDRLYSYDKLFNTIYGDSYEDIPAQTRVFIERKEEEEYIIFDDVLKMIEKFQETETVKSIYSVYIEKKRA